MNKLYLLLEKAQVSSDVDAVLALHWLIYKLEDPMKVFRQIKNYESEMERTGMKYLVEYHRSGTNKWNEINKTLKQQMICTALTLKIIMRFELKANISSFKLVNAQEYIKVHPELEKSNSPLVGRGNIYVHPNDMKLGTIGKGKHFNLREND